MFLFLTLNGDRDFLGLDQGSVGFGDDAVDGVIARGFGKITPLEG